MAASNFFYINRCIVVTDEDYEIGSIPFRGECISINRSYPSRKLLKVSDNFKFFDVIITQGYYEGACIDYIKNDASVEDWLGSTCYYDSKTSFFNECKKEFNLTEYHLRKICGNVGNLDIETYLESAYEKLTNYLRSKEEIEVNKCLDDIKENYGYDELRLVGRFSNGEAVYDKVV